MSGGIEFAKVVKLLTAEQFARRELKMRGNRAQCPFHGGEHYNLQFFSDGKCYCHVCHAGGDVVQLAAATWHTDRLTAAKQLNSEWRLGVCDTYVTTAEQAAQRRVTREAERAQREHEAAEQRQRWATSCEAEREAQAKLERFTAADADKPEFDQALHQLATAQLRLDMMWAGVD